MTVTMDMEIDFKVDSHQQRQSAEAVTRSIRSKSNSIETQLRNARNLATGATQVYLPKKLEFVLDWLLERLRKNSKDG